ncbi:VIT1/CCC1 transporter family protein [Alicyclobacillus ferrooxydans]|nr:VIT1/CCC1 transporter family protein [Alicyclobacillus ferrooxydans]
MEIDGKQQNYLKKTLVESWRKEIEAAKLYQLTAQREHDPKRKEILLKLAEVEFRHAQTWVDKLKELEYPTESLVEPEVELPKNMNTVQMMKRIDEVEHNNMTWYSSLRNVIEDDNLIAILDQIDADEAAHQDMESLLEHSGGAEKRLDKMWKSERHASGSSDWVGDAIYGVNDGLGAIFGIISGVAGFTSNTHTVLISGFFGALASTLSMGAGAWLATKSENEVMQTTQAQERREIQNDPEHEVEELALLYQLKGFSPEESARIADQIATDEDQFLKTMVQEEFGFHEASLGSPWRSAIFGALSTLVGGLIPLIPFFFIGGIPALIAAAVVSILAHFAVGAAKSLITTRSWFTSGLEMTAVGFIVGIASYGLGWVGAVLFGTHLGG